MTKLHNYEMKFSGLERLYGQGSLTRLSEAHVCLVGVGGVGSWTAEALARSGIGEITLIDLDEVCVSNTNRQIHALDTTIGRPKVEVLAERMRLINPECQVHAVCEFFTTTTGERLLDAPFDFVVDAIDSLQNKVRLILACMERKVPLVTVGGAGGRRNPAMITADALLRSTSDGLLRRVRKSLRQQLPASQHDLALGIPCVFSRERPVFPGPDGTICEKASQGMKYRMDCESGYGTASFVTGTFGFMAAALVIQGLCEPNTTAF